MYKGNNLQEANLIRQSKIQNRLNFKNNQKRFIYVYINNVQE